MNTRLNNMIAYTLLFFAVINLCMTLVIVRVKKYNYLKHLNNLVGIALQLP